MNTNYQLILDKTLKGVEASNTCPKLLLHACCAPCSSYVLEYLNKLFEITVFFYNPNITEAQEHKKREDELIRLINTMPKTNKIDFISTRWEPQDFTEIAKGKELEPEGGTRCFECYRLRLKKTAQLAKEMNFDYFTTTLSISPHKNAQVLNGIGAELQDEFCVNYLFSDFKKRNGYKRSCELSELYGLYRQDYCGCVYSKQQRRQNDGN